MRMKRNEKLINQIEKEKMETKFPAWFNYEIISFSVDSIEELNRELIKRQLDASDVINIIHDPTHDYWYQVFCKKRK